MVNKDLFFPISFSIPKIKVEHKILFDIIEQNSKLIDMLIIFPITEMKVINKTRRVDALKINDLYVRWFEMYM